MNPKIWIPLSAAAITGVGAAWAGYQLVGQRPAPGAVQQVRFDDVVVAARPISAGAELAAEDLRILRVERGSMSGDAASTPAALIGRVVVEPIATGQPLSAKLLAQSGTTPGLAATLPKGFRAITLEIDPHSGLENFLQPEAHVDVIAALGTGDTTTARTIAQNVRVLAVAGRLRGQRLEKTGEEEASLKNKYSVTLMVTPEQAAAVELACDSGTPRLMLRPGGDEDISPFMGMSLAQLRGDEFADPFNATGSEWEPDRSIPVVTDPTPAPTTEPAQATATTPADPVAPAPAPPKSKPRTHVIEIIRAGIVTRTEMPLRSTGSRSVRTPTERAVVNNDNTPISPADE